MTDIEPAMTDIERKALALVNEVRAEWGGDWAPRTKPFGHEAFKALIRAIEQHEAFKREVSDAVEDYCGYVPPDSPCHPITRFIIAKPDPLVEVINDADNMVRKPDAPSYAEAIRAAIEARGGRIVWEGE